MRNVMIILMVMVVGGIFADWAEPRRIGEGPCISVYPVNSDSALIFWGQDSLFKTTYSGGVWSEPEYMLRATHYKFVRSEAILDSRERLWIFGISGAVTNYIIDDPEIFAPRFGPNLYPMFAPDTSGNLFYVQHNSWAFVYEFGKSLGDTIWSRDYLYLPGFPLDYQYDCLMFESDSIGFDFVWAVRNYEMTIEDTIYIINSGFNYDSPESTWDYFDTLTTFYRKVPFDAVKVIDGWMISLCDEYRFTLDSIDVRYYCCHLSGSVCDIETLNGGSFWTYTSTWPFIKLAVNDIGTEVSCVWKSPYIHQRDSVWNFLTYSNIDYADWSSSSGWSDLISLTTSDEVRHLSPMGYDDELELKPINIDSDGNTWVWWYEWVPDSGSYCYVTHENPAGISEKSPAKPAAFAISAYPNPFNSSVRIAVEGECDSPMRVEIYDVAGRRVAVAELVEARAGRLAKDTSTSSVSVKSPLSKGDLGGLFVWQPDESLPSGVYLVRARFGEQSVTNKIIYLK